MSESLKTKAVKGAIWATVENFSTQIITFVIGIILARILSPSDYGMIGMLSLFMAISQTLIDSGFANALIRKIDRNDDDYSTAFYFNVIVGIVAYLILFISAPLVADFFNVSQLTTLTRIVAIPLIINSLCIVQQAQLSIILNFKRQAIISIVSSFFSGIFGVYMAYKGLGVYALAYSTIIGQLLRCILLWTLTNWFPKWHFSIVSFNNLFSFGSKILVSGLINTIYTNIYTLFIGKFYSHTTLGLFTRAQGYANLPAYTITGLITRITYPVLSLVQQDHNQLVSVYHRMVKLSAYIVFPILIGLAILAKPLIIFLITEKWLQCVPLLQILCFAMMLYPIQSLNLNLLQVKGRSDITLKISICTKSIGALSLLISVPLGIRVMCFGIFFTSLISSFFNMFYTKKVLDVSIYHQLGDLVPSLLYSSIMAITIIIINILISNPKYSLFIGFSVGLISYFFISYLFKVEEYKLLIDLIKNRFKN